MLQSSGFYPQATVREAVEHFAKAYSAPRDAGETIELVGLDEKADARTAQLSGGQRRRLDLALALIGDPELVFLDEPTTGFDPAARRTAWNAVRNLRGLGKTVLLTTHYLDEAQELADRVAIVKDGRIVAEGPPDRARPGPGPLPRLLPVRGAARGAPDRRPHRAAAPPDERRARPRRAARGARGQPADARGRLPRADRGGRPVSTAALTWEQFRFERKLFWRNPTAAFFNFVLPLLLLLLMATAFASEGDELDVLIPGRRRHERDGHDLHRARLRARLPPRGGHPEARARHADAGRLLPRRDDRLGRAQRPAPGAARGGDRPRALRRRLAADWLLLAGFSMLGVVCFGSLGVAFAHAIPNVDSAPAYVNAVFLPLIFISGVFYSSDSLPGVLKAIAEALPLKHLIDGLSAAIVGGGGDTLAAAAVVGGWTVAGLLLAVRYFRWS